MHTVTFAATLTAVAFTTLVALGGTPAANAPRPLEAERWTQARPDDEIQVPAHPADELQAPRAQAHPADELQAPWSDAAPADDLQFPRWQAHPADELQAPRG
jgi:hypothetical protein